MVSIPPCLPLPYAQVEGGVKWAFLPVALLLPFSAIPNRAVSWRRSGHLLASLPHAYCSACLPGQLPRLATYLCPVPLRATPLIQETGRPPFPHMHSPAFYMPYLLSSNFL